MSFSRGDFDDAIMKWAGNAIAHTQRILDIGPGAGKYGHLLHRMKPEIDGVELNGSFIEKFGLKRWYREIIIANAAAYAIPENKYELVIIGDVLEHLSIPDTHLVIERALKASPLLLAVLPYASPESGDHYPGGAHLQGDLTPEVVAERYPKLRLWLCNERIGVYFGGSRAERELRLMRQA